MLFAWILLFSLLGSAGAISLAALFLLFPVKIHKVLIPLLISYASGALLAVAFLDLIPEALDEIEPSTAFPTMLAGILIFFIMEKLIIWHHCHEEECEVHAAAGPLILIGDAFHNFVDGVVIAAAFLTSIPLGIASSLAIVSHEIPQEVGDFVILLESGYGRRKAFIYNIISGLATLPAAILAYLYLPSLKSATPFVVAIAAASFIYISIADLFPRLHRHIKLKHTVYQLTFMLIGIGTIILLRAG